MLISLESIFKDARLLREEITQEVGLRDKILGLLVISVACSGLYGLVMGFHQSLLQALSAAVKVPLLFMATLAICLPTLHFVGLLFGSKVRFLQSLAVLLWGIAVMSVLLGAFAPVALFFLMSQSQYEFTLLMHVSIFAFCGIASLVIIRRNMRALTQSEPSMSITSQGAPALALYSLSKGTKAAADKAPEDQRAANDDDSHEKVREEEQAADMQQTLSNPPNAPAEELQAPPFFLHIWMALYMFVGTQMAFILSPFIGREKTFVLLHSGDGSFFQAVFRAIEGLLR